ncbi:DNA-binding protein [Parashewanella curva]|uniref:DNA-binding protein n=1 Tax=Parashewanella curva TaxID=2338552 RepID=A0A3L8PYM9_9GAMM|nr:DNA-binding protein [Parashewanella curva]
MKVEPMFYTSDEVAEVLCITKQTLYNKIHENERLKKNHPIPPFIKSGGKTLFPIKLFNEWVSQQLQSAKCL